jgi:hypothetical protein
MKFAIKVFGLGLALTTIFIVYETSRANNRQQKFEQIQIMDDKASIITKLGQPFNIYTCNMSNPPSPLIYSDQMCKDATDVYAFKRCAICEFFEPGWLTVSFNTEERVVGKYNIQSP